MSTAITPESYAEKAARLTSNWQSGSGPLRLEKSTISNLFRYQPRGAAARRLSLGEFNHVLAIDKAAGTVEVEGLTLKAGDQVALKTRKLKKGDCVCSNEVIFYPPLAEVDNSAPAYTLEGRYSGRDLGVKWSEPNTRSAFLATFTY